jgi:large subunit ribosomal protein L1
MGEISKRFNAVAALVQRGKRYALNEAVELVKKCATAKFDESVEITMRLGIDPKQSDQNVRTAAVLPHGTGTTKRVLVLAKGEKEKEAQAAGADFVGAEDLIDRISKGWLEFDVVVATPDMMREVGKLGKVLGPKGMMPNPKSGTVTFDIARIVKESKAGRVEIRADSYGIVHLGVGKASFPAGHLVANASAAIDAIVRARPAAAKGAYIRRVFLASTMGPGIEVEFHAFEPQEA